MENTCHTQGIRSIPVGTGIVSKWQGFHCNHGGGLIITTGNWSYQVLLSSQGTVLPKLQGFFVSCFRLEQFVNLGTTLGRIVSSHGELSCSL